MRRVGVDQVERLADEAEEVLAHPRDARELGAVRHLVDRDPEAEVARPEGEPLLEPENVAPHVIDRVAHRIVRHQQVVLPEHALRHVAEERTHFSGGNAPRDRSERAPGHARTELLHQRIEQRLHRRQVGIDPTVPIEHPRRRASGRTQPRVPGDQILGDDTQLVEVGDERRREIRVAQRIAAGNKTSDGTRRRPVDRIGGPGGRRFQRLQCRHFFGRPFISSRPTFIQYCTARLIITKAKPIASSGEIQ